jgi:hypothetical protein
MAYNKIIEDEEPYYGEMPELQDVWVSGKNLDGVIDEWIRLRVPEN